MAIVTINGGCLVEFKILDPIVKHDDSILLEVGTRCNGSRHHY